MKCEPSLSPMELLRIADAVRIQSEGASVRWRCVGMRLVYVTGGKEHLVLTAGTRRVFAELCRQAQVAISDLKL